MPRRRVVSISLVAVALLLVAVCAPVSVARVGANAPAPPERTVAVFGQIIHYWDVGTGPVVVLVHGLGDRKESWLTVIPALSRQYRVLALDQIGFGKSAKPLLDYNIQTYVDFLNEFLRDLNVSRATLVGESLGGWIVALDAAEESSDPTMVRLERLVIVDGAGLKQDKQIPNLNPSTVEEMRDVMKAVFYDTSWLDEATLRQIFADKIGSGDAYAVHSVMTNPVVQTELLDNRLGEIRVPTLVMWGKQDQLLPVASGEKYAAGIAGARLVTFDKCGHVPAEEQTEGFLDAITRFLPSPTQ